MALTKVSGDFIKAGSVTQAHLHSSHGITTSHLTEGDKLFFTNARVDSRIGSLSSSDLSEGTNLYYTDARARAAISATGSLSYNSTTGVMSFTMPAQNTSNITEGTNLYYTDARADARIAAADTGDLSEGTNLYYTDARADARITAASTSDLSEGTNLYYTDARADARITASDTDSLSEGSTNLYYTDARADARVALIVDSAPGTLNTLNELAAALGDDANFSTTVTNSIATKLPLAGGTLTGFIQLGANQLRFDQSGTRSWAISASGGNLNINSGDSAGNVAISSGLTVADNATFTGTIAASGYNDSNWNTAYGWGNHASAGYLTSFTETNGFLGDGGSGSTHPGTSRLIYSGQASAGSGALGMPTINNANAFINLNKHPGEYNSQLGFSSNGHIYYRNFNNAAIDGTQTWHKVYTENVFTVASVLNSNVTLATLGYTGATNANYITNNNQLTNGAAYITASGTSADSNLLDGTDWGSAASRRKLGLSALTTEDRITHSTSSRYHTGVTGWGAVDFNTLLGRGSVFFDTWANPGNQPSTEASHWNGHQVLHYTDSSNYHHGYQMAVGAGNPAYCYIRGWWASGGSGSGWAKMYNSHNLTLAVLGYTGATNANYITNNNQLTNGAGYTTNTGTLTNSNDRNYITDTRGSARAPSYYDDRYAQWDFQNSSDTGVGGDGWHALLTVSKWASWDASHRQEQIIFSGENLWHRTASSDSAWGTSKKIWDSSNLTNNNQLSNGSGFLTSSIGGTKFSFVSGSGGSTFGNNHYSMGVDIANGAWSNPHYSDLIIGYHTGIRIGASYSGTRFYSNSPTTDTNNTGNGNGNEALIFTVGGAAGANDTKVEGIGYAGESFRSPLFYDNNNTAYVFHGDGTSVLNQAYILGSTSGWSLQLGPTDATRVYSDAARASLVINSTLYPHLYINATAGTSNSNHGAAMTMTGNISGGYRRWSMGWANWNPTVFTMGSYDSNSNPHYGCGGQMGVTTWGSRFWFNTSGSGQAQADWRAPIFYDSANTGYYVDPASTSNLNTVNIAGGTFNGTLNGNASTVTNGVYVNGTQTMTGTTYFNANRNTSSSSPPLQVYGTNSGAIMAFHRGGYYAVNFGLDSDNVMRIGGWSAPASRWQLDMSGHNTVAGSSRAPLFYDSLNTAYYSDPAGTGLLNAVTLNYINYKNSNFRVGDSTTMNAITSGGQNVAFGPEALGACNTGTRNFAYGYAALASLTSGANNIAMGDACGYNVTTGSNNLLFGVAAGRTGYQSPQSIAGVTSHNHQIHMGNESHTTARIQISWTVNSDARDKTDITPIDVGLDFVKQLNPVTYRWDKRSDYEDRTPDGTNKLPELTLGFLAQEVEVVEKSFGYDVANQTNLVVDRIPEQDHYGITYEKMVPILTKAIQEQQTIIDDLKSRLETLENQ
jgi:hypothetical protein